EGLPDEVRLTYEKARGVCADIAGGGARRDAALATIYVVSVDAAGFGFTPFDARRARLALDTASFRTQDGIELPPHDRVGPPEANGLDMPVPASATGADGMVSAYRAGSLGLELWFHMSRPSDGRAVCAVSHGGDVSGKGLRVAVEPMAFEVRRE